MAQIGGGVPRIRLLDVKPSPHAQAIKVHPVKVPRSLQTSGGYDCEFVEKPPNVIETECSICLHILRIPKIIDCCGHNFCSTCIDRIAQGGNCCPLCNEEVYTLVRNKGLERSLNELDVKCSYFSKGCAWTGKLGQFTSHISGGKSRAMCGFIEVKCQHKCGDYFERRSLKQHEEDECSKRPFSCDYCREYSSTFENIVSNHYSVCPSYPLPCPNNCDLPHAILRKDLASHVGNDCPLTVVDCDFHYAGCAVRLPRKDMPDHLRENITHLSLMAAKLMEKDKQIATVTAIATVTSDLVRKQDILEKDNKALRQEVSALREQVKCFNKKQACSTRNIQSMTDRLQHSVKSFRREFAASTIEQRKELHVKIDSIDNKVEQNCKGIASLCFHTGLPPCDFFMINFSDLKKRKDEWFSESFYTHPKGYKMCVKAYASGFGTGKDTHLSLYIFLMRGEFDDHLKWPFRGKLTIRLVNQSGGEGHRQSILVFDGLTPDHASARVTVGEKAIEGWGYQQVIAHHLLKPYYLHNDQLHFRITNITV